MYVLLVVFRFIGYSPPWLEFWGSRVCNFPSKCVGAVLMTGFGVSLDRLFRISRFTFFDRIRIWVTSHLS